jgi:pimeloyl-ACP methyl ester carboxylesterase
MFDEQLVAIGRLRLNLARARSDGPPLVLVHGVLRRWTTFLPLAPSLMTRWQVVAIDQRGHGRSDRAADAAYRVIDYVDDLVTLLDEHVHQPAVLYGHSLGAMVVAGAAARRPERVRAVVLEDPPFETMGRRIRETALAGYFEQLLRLVRQGLEAAEMSRQLAEIRLAEPATGRSWRLGDVRDVAQLRFQAACLAAVDPQVLEPIVAAEWLAGYDWETVLAGVRAPALVLETDEAAGGMLTDADAARARELLVDGAIVRLAGAGHALHTARTVEVSNLVLAFLSALE